MYGNNIMKSNPSQIPCRCGKKETTISEVFAFEAGQKDARLEIWQWAKNYQRMKCSGCDNKTVSHSLWCRFRQDLIKLLEQQDEK